jgi:excisionase family DNA binding protein
MQTQIETQLSVKEAAQMLAVSTATVHRMIRDGMTHSKPRGNYRIPLSAVQAKLTTPQKSFVRGSLKKLVRG